MRAQLFLLVVLRLGVVGPGNQLRIECFVEVVVIVAADAVAVGESVVELDVVLIAVGLSAAGAQEVVEDGAVIRSGKQRQDIAGHAAKRDCGMRLPGN